jgi:hypothetical protein
MQFNFFVLLVLFYSAANGQTFHTVGNGYWDEPNNWIDGRVPGDTIRDSMFIKHAIVYQENKVFEAPIHVSSRGVLCGFDSLVFNQASLEVYSLVRLGVCTFNQSTVYMDNSFPSFFLQMRFFNSSSLSTGPNHHGMSVVHDSCDIHTLITLGLEKIKEGALTKNWLLTEQSKIPEFFYDKNFQIYSSTGNQLFIQKDNLHTILQLHKGIYFYITQENGSLIRGRFLIL